MRAIEPAKAVLPRAVKNVGRIGVRRVGLLTAGERVLPDYLIIGTKRGGTTSLWKNLRRHPQVMSMFPEAENLKSPHFFDIHYLRGERWYQSYFPTRRARAAHAAAVGGPAVVGEASPYYLFHPQAAGRAAAVVPRARIIVALRHPVDRAWSHYQERIKAGAEWLPFAEALDAENERLAVATEMMREAPDRYCPGHDSFGYLARGRYLEQLRPWLEHFSTPSILVLRSESYYEDPVGTLQGVAGFLGLDPDVRASTPPEHMNRLPSPVIDSSLRARLNGYFRPHVEELEAALGRDFGWDLTSTQREAQ